MNLSIEILPKWYLIEIERAMKFEIGRIYNIMPLNYVIYWRPSYKKPTLLFYYTFVPSFFICDVGFVSFTVRTVHRQTTKHSLMPMVRRRVHRCAPETASGHSLSPGASGGDLSPRTFQTLIEDDARGLKLRHPFCNYNHRLSFVIRMFIWVLVVLIIIGLLSTMQDVSENRYDSPERSETSPRVVYYDGTFSSKDQNLSWFIRDPMLNVIPGEECIPQPLNTADKDSNCVPMKSWQTNVNPTCNSVHEFDMGRSIKRTGGNMPKLNIVVDEEEVNYSDYALGFLGRGWWRHTWLLATSSESVVLKTLR